MTIFRFEMLLLLSVATAQTAPTVEPGWQYRDFSQAPYHSVDAMLHSRDGGGAITIDCSFAAEPTLSIQYLPSPDVGIGMGPVELDWLFSKTIPLGAKLVWEPDQKGAFARDGFDDRVASEVAEALEKTAGTVAVTATDRNGTPVRSIYDSGGNRDAIRRVLARCPWKPDAKQDR